MFLKYISVFFAITSILRQKLMISFPFLILLWF